MYTLYLCYRLVLYLGIYPNGGSLLHCSDPWILQAVSGYHLEFETTPHQVNLPKFPKFTKRETALIESEIRKLISKGAVTEVSPCNDEFISTVFLVPKKTGDFRPVINLKPFNQFVEKIHFKMDNIRMALNCISPGCFFQCTYFPNPSQILALSLEFQAL